MGYTSTVADPGFPVWGGCQPVGGTNIRCVHFSVKTYAKTKEIDPVGGGPCRQHPPWIRQCTSIMQYEISMTVCMGRIANQRKI